jgi:hypothetical protein
MIAEKPPDAAAPGFGPMAARAALQKINYGRGGNESTKLGGKSKEV